MDSFDRVLGVRDKIFLYQFCDICLVLDRVAPNKSMYSFSNENQKLLEIFQKNKNFVFTFEIVVFFVCFKQAKMSS